MARPAGLSPSNWAISERSMPSPASAVPLSSFAISSAHFGRRARPSKAILASLAMPIPAAQSERAASDISSALESMCQLRQFSDFRVREQELDLGYALGDAI